MTYEAMARRWRPQLFAEVAAQAHITETLRKAVDGGRVAAAYLFAGPRGSGKTTVARIVAKAVNCEKRKAGEPCDICDSCTSVTSGRSMDVLEIDGASNNSVDDVRELRENVRYAPSAPGKRKVYIIDEVHMLSPGAFNALLKTLEEPPPHVVFLFATTEPNKLPKTILSRCQRFDFRRLLASEILERLRFICKKEKTKVEDGALFLLAKRAEGSLRDALSSLDQVISSTSDGVREADVAQVLGVVREESYLELTEAVLERDTVRALDVLHGALRQGVDASGFALGLVEHLRNLLLLSIDSKLKEAVSFGEVHLARAEKLARRFRTEDLLYLMNRGASSYEEARRAAQPTLIVEAFLVEMTRFESRIVLEELLAKLDREPGSNVPGRERTGGRRTLPEARPASKPRSSGTGKDRKIQGTGTSPTADGNPARIAPWSGPSDRAGRPGFEGPVAGPRGGVVGAASVGPVLAAAGNEPVLETTEAATAVRPTALDIQQVREKWHAFTQALRDQKAMLAHCLSEGRPTRLESSTVQIWFPPEHTFHLNLFREVTKKREIEQYLQAYFGMPLRVALCEDSPATKDVVGKVTPAELASTAAREVAQPAPEDRVSPAETGLGLPAPGALPAPKPGDHPAPDVAATASLDPNAAASERPEPGVAVVDSESNQAGPVGLDAILEAFEGEIEDDRGS